MAAVAEQTPTRRRVLVVDDHPVFRKGVASILQNSADFEVCGDAADGREALSLMRREKPSLVMMDISLPGHNGVELIKMMKAEQPEMEMVVLTVHSETSYAVRAIKAGARGYLLKGESPPEILEALRRVAQGELYLSPSIRHQIIFRAVEALDSGKDLLLQRLTRREREIFDLLGQGMTAQQIADHMGLSTKTVDTHRMHVREKLYCSDAAELAKFAADWHLYCKKDDDFANPELSGSAN